MKRYRHNLEDLGEGHYRVTLDKRAGTLHEDFFELATLIAASKIEDELSAARALEDMAADEPEDSPERRKARSAQRERRASYVTSNPFERITAGIKSLASVIAGFVER